MNGVSRGARLWALLGGDACPVIVLDRGPDGWWLSFEGKTDARGHDLMEQRPARHIYPSKGAALGVLAAKR